MKSVLCAVLLLAVLALGQTWIVEQIDSTAAGASPVELAKAADGRLWACYRTAGGFVRAACLGDSGWSMTDICWGYVPTNAWRPFLAASPHGELCLSCVTGDSGWLFRLVGDSWQGEPYPFTTRSMCGTVAYDTAGRLHTAFDDTAGDFWAGHETDSGWTAGFVARLSIEGSDHGDAACFTVAPDCSPWYFAYVWWMKPPQLWGEEASLMHFSGDSWVTVWNQSGQYMPIPLALVPHGDGVGYVSLGDGVLLCDSEVVASASDNSVAGLTYTAEDVPLVAWVPRGSAARPYFAFKTDRWRTTRMPGQTGMGGVDIEVRDDGQVIIVFSTRDAGLWCARGTDVLGVSQASEPASKRRASRPSLVGAGLTGRLYDASGRQVTGPRAGVYFVREGQSSQVRRVVVVR